MEKGFDIAVIGGGIYGCVCAYFLAQNNRKVLLIEKNRVGISGATGYSRGIVRAFDADESLAEISLAGAMDLLHWEKHRFPGINPYNASGFLFMMDAEKEAIARQAVNRYGSDAYPMELMTSGSISKRFPWIRESKNKIGLYEQYGGYGDPRLTAQNFMEGFRMKGGIVYENCEVQGFEPAGNDTWNVDLPFGKITAKTLLFATGAFTKRWLPGLPVFTRSISLAQVSSNYNGSRIPVVDECVETYLRPGDDSSFYCGSQVEDVATLPEQLPYRTNEAQADAIIRIRQVVNDEVEAINCFTGFDGYTEEKKPVVQFIKEMPGIYAAAGFSGRGYKCAVSMGRKIAAEINNHIGSGGNTTGNINWRIVI
jgi:glycine/D-amino acid oxidase-like deaminating enzyme